MSVEEKGAESDERLRRIEAVTDASLSRLNVEDLLVELLDRVRALLDVDTAAVLLLDQHSQQLVATATRGLEEEVHQGVRLPVGQGFAGRIARDKVPIIIERVDHTNVINPILREKGIRSLLGVPMLAGGEVIGVLHVGTLTPRQFTEEDTNLLQLAADRVSLATQTRLGGIDRAAALALQRSLLPTRLPQVPGIQIAARYIPGHDTGVGGDWYDVFVLPSGWLGIVIGDVSGHGLRAAVVMGRLRSALRAYALDGDDPGEVLARLDRKIDHFEPGSMTTALYAMIAPELDRVLISVAGHPPPVLAQPDSLSAPLSPPVDLPLGTGSQPVRRTTAVVLPPGSLLLFYTDGLIERRGESIDVGLQRLTAAVDIDSADAVCNAVMAKLVFGEPPADDIALLVLRRHDGAVTT